MGTYARMRRFSLGNEHARMCHNVAQHYRRRIHWLNDQQKTDRAVCQKIVDEHEGYLKQVRQDAHGKVYQGGILGLRMTEMMLSLEDL